MIKLSELQPTHVAENLIVVPTFLTGKLKEAILPAYLELAGTNPNFALCDKDKGSNLFIVGGMNSVLRGSGFRMVVPTDNIYETIVPMIEDKYYTDLNALDVREKKSSHKKNRGLWQKVVNLAEENQGKVEFPFRIQDFDCVVDNSEEDYQAKIIPGKNFRVIHDKRLNLPPGTRFNTLDQNGMIVPHENGTYTWYFGEEILSRVYLTRSSGIGSWGGSLAGSNELGRGVVVDAA